MSNTSSLPVGSTRSQGRNPGIRVCSDFADKRIPDKRLKWESNETSARARAASGGLRNAEDDWIRASNSRVKSDSLSDRWLSTMSGSRLRRFDTSVFNAEAEPSTLNRRAMVL